MFVITALLGLLLTGFALSSRYYRQLSARYAGSSTEESPPTRAVDGAQKEVPGVAAQALRSADGAE